MQKSWTTPTANMTYTRSQNYTNMVVDKHGIQTFEILVVVLLRLLKLFDVFVPTSAHPLLFLNMLFIQIYLNVNYTIMVQDECTYIGEWPMTLNKYQNIFIIMFFSKKKLPLCSCHFYNVPNLCTC